MSTIMSVYSALRECKLLEKKINKAYTEPIMPAAFNPAKDKMITTCNHTRVDVDTFLREEASKLQSYEDLKARLKRIKAAIAVANMDTIKVAGKEYTVFEALMMKSEDEVNAKRSYLHTLRTNYSRVVQKYTSQMENIEQEAYEASLQFLKGVGAILPTLSEVKTAVETNIPTDKIPDLAIASYNRILEERKLAFHEIKPNFKAWLDKEEDDFDRFLAEVDIAITTFNMSRMIEIED